MPTGVTQAFHIHRVGVSPIQHFAGASGCAGDNLIRETSVMPLRQRVDPRMRLARTTVLFAEARSKT